MSFFLMSLLSFTGLLLIFVVLLQRGRGGGLAGAFGGAGGQSAFGTRAGDVFTKITIVLVVIWVVLAGATGFAMRAGAVKNANQFQTESTEPVIEKADPESKESKPKLDSGDAADDDMSGKPAPKNSDATDPDAEKADTKNDKGTEASEKPAPKKPADKPDEDPAEGTKPKDDATKPEGDKRPDEKESEADKKDDSKSEKPEEK